MAQLPCIGLSWPLTNRHLLGDYRCFSPRLRNRANLVHLPKAGPVKEKQRVKESFGLEVVECQNLEENV